MSLLVAFGASNALAQGKSATGAPTTTAQKTQAGKAGAGAPSAGPWTADNVTAAQPFGGINVSAAGTTEQSVRTWSQGRSASERAEISGRCNVITNPANSSRYPSDAQQFCRTYMTVASANPPAGKAK